MEPELIETCFYEGEGYRPLLIRDNWQVAWLNYMPGQGLDEIVKVDKHLETDEVFVLVRGIAVLIAAEENGGELNFQCISMKPGLVYNIPMGTWHNIAMDKRAEIIIIEKSDTHLGDFVYRPLSETEKKTQDACIRNVLESP